MYSISHELAIKLDRYGYIFESSQSMTDSWGNSTQSKKQLEYYMTP
jgi:hypothetical protein